MRLVKGLMGRVLVQQDGWAINVNWHVQLGFMEQTVRKDASVKMMLHALGSMELVSVYQVGKANSAIYHVQKELGDPDA